ncbi:MAG TPA: MFS transporter, partial [Paracoccaceae bacterium]|nr:MFS transporter [Paracoccaceae bacterium]
LGAPGQAAVAGAAALTLVLLASLGLVRSHGRGSGLLGAGLSRVRRVWLLGHHALVAIVTEGAVIDWSALYLRRELGAGVEFSGFAFAFFSLAMLAGRFSGDALRRRLGARRLLRLSTLLAGAGFFVAGAATSLPVAVAGFLLAGLGCSNIVPVAFSAAARAAMPHAGAGIATATILGYVGLLTAPATLGHVGELAGFAPVFMAFTLLMVAGFLLAPAARETG